MKIRQLFLAVFLACIFQIRAAVPSGPPGGATNNTITKWTGTNSLGGITNGSGFLSNNGSGTFTWAIPSSSGSGITNSGTGTAGTLAIWTDTNSLGNSALSDVFGTLLYTNTTIVLGPDDGSQSTVTIKATTTTNSFGGLSIDFIAGEIDGSTSGDGGSMTFRATDGVGTDKNGGSLTFNTGNKTGTGNPGNFAVNSDGDIALDAGFFFTIGAPNGFNPDSDNSYPLGTNGSRWLGVYSYGEDVDGDIRVSGNVSPRDVPYIWPVSQGAAGTMLINDGGGILTWEPTNSASGGVTTSVTPLAYSGTNITGFNCLTNNATYTLLLTNHCLFNAGSFTGLPNTTTNMFFTLALKQDGTGTWVPKFTNSIVAWSEGVQPVVTTNANSISYLYFHSHLWTNGMLVGSPNLNVK